jgi:hypothetical protein
MYQNCNISDILLLFSNKLLKKMSNIFEFISLENTEQNVWFGIPGF